MIVPGEQLGKIKIGDDLKIYPDACFVRALSLGQNTYQWDKYKIRFDENNKVNLISTQSVLDNSYLQILNIDVKFEIISKAFQLLYDEDEFTFTIKDIKGLCFSLDFPLQTKGLFQKTVTDITVYDIKMDEHNDFFLEEVTEDWLEDYK